MELQLLARSSVPRRHPKSFKTSSSRAVTQPSATPSRICVAMLTLDPLSGHPKGKTSSGDMGHSSCMIHAAFHAERLLLYVKKAQTESRPSLQIGEDHNLPSVVLGNSGQIVGYVVTYEGPNGLVDVL